MCRKHKKTLYFQQTCTEFFRKHGIITGFRLLKTHVVHCTRPEPSHDILLHFWGEFQESISEYMYVNI